MLRDRRSLLGMTVLAVVGLLGFALWAEKALNAGLLEALARGRVRTEAITSLRRDVRKTQLAVLEQAFVGDPDGRAWRVEARARLAVAFRQLARVDALGLQGAEPLAALARVHASVLPWAEHVRAMTDEHAPLAVSPAALRGLHQEVDLACEDLLTQVSTEGQSLEATLLTLEHRRQAVQIAYVLTVTAICFAALRRWRRLEVAEGAFRSSEKARAELRAMAASVAHEVNNQLGVLQNTLGLLKRQHPDEPLLRYQEESVEQIQRLTRDLSAFSSLTPGPRERVDLVQLMRSSAQSLMCEVSVRADGPAWVEVDRAGLGRALLNVLKNALEAGGPVEVEIRRDDKGVLVSCSDSGPGIPANHLPRVGEPFFTTKAKGTGLGLALVKKVVSDHGGRFVLGNRAGRGAVAQLWFPGVEERH